MPSCHFVLKFCRSCTHGPLRCPPTTISSDTHEGVRVRARVARPANWAAQILDEIVGMAKRAVNRLCSKLDKHRESGEPIDIGMCCGCRGRCVCVPFRSICRRANLF